MTMRLTRSISFAISGLPLFIAAVLFFASCERESPVVIFANSLPGDEVAPGGHVIYDVTARSCDGIIESVSLTEMSDETGLKLIDKRKTSGKIVSERFDYQDHETQKDTSVFLIIFEACDDSGNTQEFRKTLKVIRPKPSGGEGETEGGSGEKEENQI